MFAATRRHIAPKLIVADDDPAVVKIVTNFFEGIGFRVASASNGMQLLVKVRQNAPDLLIVDVNMPQLDGLSASAHMLEPGGHPMDIIVMTGSSDTETIERCDSLGMYYCRKGAEFWSSMQIALIEIFPHLTDRITEQASLTASRSEVPVRPRVLIVDDDPAIAALLSSRLTKYGIQLLQASNATQALRIAVKQRPTVILTDYEMPDGDAHHLLARLRVAPETNRIPVLVFSGRDIDPVTAGILQREIQGFPGASAILKKSLDLRELFMALEHFCALEHHSARSQRW